MKIVTLDFETYYSDEYGLNGSTTIEYIRDPRFKAHMVGIKIDDGPVRILIGDAIARHFYNNRGSYEKACVVCHNAQFDGTILSEVYNIHPKLLLCTMLMAYGVYGPHLESYSLDALSESLLGERKVQGVLAQSKGLETLPTETLTAMAGYCRQDVGLTYKLFQKMKGLISPAELRLVDLTNRFYTQPKLEVDVELLQDFLGKYNDYQQRVLDSVGLSLADLRSDARFATVLEGLGVEPAIKKTKKGEGFAFAKTDSFMQELLEHEDTTIAALAAARVGMRSSIEQTRVEKFIRVGSTGAMPVPLQYCGAITGRFSGRKGEALNLQNLPKKSRVVSGTHPLRMSLMAPKGHKVVVVDSAQIEARGVGVLADERWLVEAFRNKRDVYSEFASTLFSRAITKADEKERFVGKQAVLALGYGMGFAKFAVNLHSGVAGPALTFDEGFMYETDACIEMITSSPRKYEMAMANKPRLIGEQEWLVHCAVCDWVVGVYRGTNTNITGLWKELEKYYPVLCEGGEVAANFGGVEFVFDKGVVHLPSGRKIIYPNIRMEGRKPVYDYRETRTRVIQKSLWGGTSLENYTQAITRDVIGVHMLKISEQYPVVGMVHDEVVAIAPDEEAQECLEFMIQVMQTPPKWMKHIPLGAEGEIGNNYGECK